MKHVIRMMIVAWFVLMAACGPTNMTGLRITNPGGLPVAYSGYYQSNYTDRKEVDGVTKASHKVHVFKKGDHIRAGFVKTDPADSVNPLNIKLYYGGKRREAEVVIPGDTAYIDFKF